jgi:hypothetical protein
VGYDLVGPIKGCRWAMTWSAPKPGQERESVFELACGQAGSILFCDKGLWGRELDGTLELIDIELITPGARHRLGERPAAEVEKASSATCSPAAQRERSPPTTDAKPTSTL